MSPWRGTRQPSRTATASNVVDHSDKLTGFAALRSSTPATHRGLVNPPENLAENWASRSGFVQWMTMTPAAVPVPPSTTYLGGVRFVEPTRLDETRQALATEGLLVVDCGPWEGSARGRLGFHLDDAVERALLAHGAFPAGAGPAGDLLAALGDQLYRARLLGSRGLAMIVPSLSAIATLSGVLDGEDSAALRWWLRACRDRPICVVLDAADRELGIYESPVFLSRVVASIEMGPFSAPRPKPACPPVPVTDLQETDPTPRCPTATATGVEPGLSNDASPDSPDQTPCALNESQGVIHSALNSDSGDASPDSPDQTRGALNDTRGDVLSALNSDSGDASPDSPNPARMDRESPVDDRPVDEPPTGSWQKWMDELSRARGPRPLACIEQLYTTAYVPLAAATMRGLSDPSAHQILKDWSASFAHSYSDAFDALRVRGKRPLMVLDVPDISLRIARLHSARSVQLVLVDGLRLDLGLMVEKRLAKLLADKAMLAERLLLWSGLPSTTDYQLHLIANGPDGLRDPGGREEIPALVAKGAAAAQPRRIRAGRRDVHKLDLVEARLANAGARLAARLPELADEVADALARSMRNLPERTLVFVFGDHGFVIDDSADGSSRMRAGGATPEEVLVPAQAWLIGAPQ